MRVLYYSNYSHPTGLSFDSSWNLAVEFTKYASRELKDEAFVMYLTKPKERGGLRGDEEQYIRNGNMILIEHEDSLTDGRLSTFWVSTNLAEKLSRLEALDGGVKEPVVYNVLYHNTPYAIPALLALNRVAGHEGVPMVCRIDWFPSRSQVRSDRNISYLLVKLLQLYASVMPVLVHSKYCLKLMGIPENSEDAYTFLKWGIFYPPYDSEMVVKDKPVNSEPVIIFNHRITGYTGFVHLVRALQEIPPSYKFKIVLPESRVGSVRSSYSMKEERFIPSQLVDKKVYWKTIGRCDAVIGWHLPYGNGWSISILEAVGSGCYPITHYKSFYPEMLGGEGVLPEFEVSEEGLRDALIYFLDNLEYCMKKARQLSGYVESRWSWKVQVKNWLGILQKVIDSSYNMVFHGGGEGLTIKRLVEGRNVFRMSELIEHFASRDKSGGRWNIGHKGTVFSDALRFLRKNGWRDKGGRDPLFVRGE
ncbi:MAG: glycosyltransferase [Candidatus Caldarchaeum sp.]